MTNELKKILDELIELIQNLNDGKIPTQEEFIDELKKKNVAMGEELKNVQPEQTKIE